jgi:hypothetical protein
MAEGAAKAARATKWEHMAVTRAAVPPRSAEELLLSWIVSHGRVVGAQNLGNILGVHAVDVEMNAAG